MKNYIIAALLILGSGVAYADSSSLALTLPGASNSFGSDSIRAGDLDCKNSIGGATNLEFGVTGIIDNYGTPFSGNMGNDERDIGIFARIVIPLDKPKERINCNSLYQIELRKKRLEVLKLQQELEALKRLNADASQGFEN